MTDKPRRAPQNRDEPEKRAAELGLTLDELMEERASVAAPLGVHGAAFAAWVKEAKAQQEVLRVAAFPSVRAARDLGLGYVAIAKLMGDSVSATTVRRWLEHKVFVGEEAPTPADQESNVRSAS